MKTIPHKNDGLIFTQITPAYQPGTNKTIIKWKPPHMNTVDFYVCPNTNIENIGVKILFLKYILIYNIIIKKKIIIINIVFICKRWQYFYIFWFNVY